MDWDTLKEDISTGIKFDAGRRILKICGTGPGADQTILV